ncbi:carboxymuconolactone decarboxylase family protein [Pseudonocardia abyssalis]|uniref:Carboxymuconolactone decarboxylase family protein n=1 Tax=Pseudonocardia abyssalis TaxID=2792008 RepID=A0ABS6UND2_9PSEU|nr:carboxymuconolactone decarboxylase family protein [Pseudonocardia abyssalis]MBW0115097.1 carboxymuconolactone decarboxylase family protein [Pseudonocardia abyssalis]MBW0133763.1 carboxymuconolactone decarboxylase family protein [Pseudonocardia abyssalis]
MTERLTRLRPDDMTPEQAEIYACFTDGRRADPAAAFSLVHPDGGLVGPPDAWLRSPPLGRVLERIGWVLRFDLELSDRAREIAILLHAFHRASPFELYAHRRAGLAAGLSGAEIEGLASRTEPAFRSGEERLVFATTLAVLDRRDLDDAEYDAAAAELGERGVFELLALLGYYDLVATQLAVFGVEPPVTG